MYYLGKQSSFLKAGRGIFWGPTLYKALSLFPEALCSATIWNSLSETKVLKLTSSNYYWQLLSFLPFGHKTGELHLYSDRQRGSFLLKAGALTGMMNKADIVENETFFACNSILVLSAIEKVFPQFSSAFPICDDTFQVHFQQLPCPYQLSAVAASAGVNFASDVQVSSFCFLLWEGNGVPPSLSRWRKKKLFCPEYHLSSVFLRNIS